ncbi:hypothetical protein AB0M19_14545 [Streptomyces sp. NPDC051920]|uniref:hypothetical protein n=1 Tax=Streptomyces sp. NPDC051920 TaxID=3155523 RepID=UPI003416AFF2
MTVLFGLLGAAFGGLAGAVAGYVTNRSGMLMQLSHTYDVALRDRRLEHYARLFHLTERIPRRWRPGHEPDRAQLLEHWETFHHWYFGEAAGGMFLTPASKSCYLALQNALLELGRDGAPGGAAAEPLAEGESRLIRHLASELRHQLAEDVGAAHPPRLRWARVNRTVDLPPVTPPV